MNLRLEQARGGETMGVSHWPDHWGEQTWHRCIAPGCSQRVDPWDHNTRCPDHRPPPDQRGDDTRARRREVARAIVTAARERRVPT